MSRARGVYVGVVFLALSLGTFEKVTISQGDRQPAVPAFRVDPFWPTELPKDWLLGNVVGVAADSHDNIWVAHRPNSQPGAEKTPAVIQFDHAGNVLKTLGPGEGYEWGNQQHGAYVDYKDNVWIGFSGGLPYNIKEKSTYGNAHFLKFSSDGKFLLQVGKFGMGLEGSNSTQYLGQPTDAWVDANANEVYISDGYTNRRVIVFDADTGAYKRHWGAYGKTPDDAPMPKFDPNAPPPQQFNTPHCISGTSDGLVYVCDRGNFRIQVLKYDGTFVKEAVLKAKDGNSSHRGISRSRVIASRGWSSSLMVATTWCTRCCATRWRFWPLGVGVDAGPVNSSRPTIWRLTRKGPCTSQRRWMGGASRSSCGRGRSRARQVRRSNTGFMSGTSTGPGTVSYTSAHLYRAARGSCRRPPGGSRTPHAVTSFGWSARSVPAGVLRFRRAGPAPPARATSFATQVSSGIRLGQAGERRHALRVGGPFSRRRP